MGPSSTTTHKKQTSANKDDDDNDSLSLPTSVLPGDDLTPFILTPSSSSSRRSKRSSTAIPKLGTGLHCNSTTQKITSTLAGRLCHRSSTNTYYVQTNTKRYIPTIHDRVIGVIEDRYTSDYYRVNIFGAYSSASLHTLAFDGATKRNKPNLVPGTLVYCRVIRADRDVDPELTCKVESGTIMDSDGATATTTTTKRKDWMTDECIYGQLKGGTAFPISIGLARELLLPTNVVLDALNTTTDIPFEICIGVNGWVWVHSTRPEYTILVVNAIRNSEVMTEEQVRGMVKALVKTVRDSLDE